MIKANELRIGNIVLIEGNIRRVMGLDSKGVNGVGKGEGVEYEMPEGVSVTSELLEKCGFEKLKKQSSGYQGYLLNEFEIGSSQDQEFYFSASNREGYRNEVNVVINYLHQLQNLFFALTGEELEVNI